MKATDMPQDFYPVFCPRSLATVLSDSWSWETYQGSQVRDNSEVKTVIAVRRRSVLRKEMWDGILF